MEPVDRLIVSLDLIPAKAEFYVERLAEIGIRFFKLDVDTLLQAGGWPLVKGLATVYDIFLDLKFLGTRDTVYRTVRHAFDMGVKFVTVDGYRRSVIEAAMRAKPDDPRCKVLAVGPMTDRAYTRSGWVALDSGIAICDGVICPRIYLSSFRAENGARRDQVTEKLLVTPGIRLAGDAADNHVNPVTPAEAIKAGADYIVVGSSIYNAAAPVVAAVQVIDEIRGAMR